MISFKAVNGAMFGSLVATTGVLAFAVNIAVAQELTLNPRLELRVMTYSWTAIVKSGNFKTELLESAQVRITIPRSSFIGDTVSLGHFTKILSKSEMVILVIELPAIDDTEPVFLCLQDLGPVQVCATVKLGGIELYQEAVVSNVKYRSDKLVTFDFDLFADTRDNLSPAIRARSITELEVCGSNIALLNIANR